MFSPMTPPPMTRKSDRTASYQIFHGAFAGLPQLFEVIFLAQGIHAGPEAGVAVSHELVVLSEPFNGLALPDRFIAGDVIDRLALQHIEPAVDPALVTMRLFLEAGNQVLVVLQTAESSRRQHGGNRGKLPMGIVELDECLDVDVCNPITVRKEKRLVHFKPLLQTPQASPGLGVHTGIHEVHLPILMLLTVMDYRFPGPQFLNEMSLLNA